MFHLLHCFSFLPGYDNLVKRREYKTQEQQKQRKTILDWWWEQKMEEELSYFFLIYFYYYARIIRNRFGVIIKSICNIFIINKLKRKLYFTSTALRVKDCTEHNAKYCVASFSVVSFVCLMLINLNQNLSPSHVDICKIERNTSIRA